MAALDSERLKEINNKRVLEDRTLPEKQMNSEMCVPCARKLGPLFSALLKVPTSVFNRSYDHRDDDRTALFSSYWFIVRHISNTMRIPVPYTVIVFLLGVVFGFLPVGAIADMAPFTIIIIFMPVLIFEGAFAIDVYIFKQIFMQVLLLAFPALVMMICLTGIISLYVFKYEGFDWKICMLFGSILSATDPVAVVSIMKELGVKKHLSLLIEGESMLNDGTAMVFFGIFMEIIKNDLEFNFGDTLKRLCLVSTGGPFVGYVMARIAVFWLGWTFNDSLTEVLITLGTSYITFYIAEEFLAVSGVLAVVTCGVVISGHKTCISPEVEAFMHCFWETLSFLANTLIFALSGLIISKKVLVDVYFADFIRLLILYVVLHVIRGVTIFMFSPILRQLGYGMTWQEGMVATWSGLRGAIGLTLALLVFLTMEDRAVGNEILFQVSMIVVLTLFINATSIGALLKFLGVSGVNEEGRTAMHKAITMLDSGRKRSILTWKIDRFLTNANWTIVKSFCTIPNPYSTTKKVDKQVRRIICPTCRTVIPHVLTPEERHRMKADAVRKYLKLFQKAIWEQFEHGTLSGYGAQKLNDMIEQAYDTDLQTVSVRAVKAIWKVPEWIRRVESVVLMCRMSVDKALGSDYQKQNIPLTTRAFYRWRKHWLLVFCINGLLFVVVVIKNSLYIFDIHHVEIVVGIDRSMFVMLGASLFFLIFRLYSFGCDFIRVPWFTVDLISVVVLGIELGGQWLGVLHWVPVPGSAWGFKLEAELLIMRIIYALPLLETLNTAINYKIFSKKLELLRFFYDVGWAYVYAVEKVALNLACVIDHNVIRENIITHAQDSKMDLIRELGLVQGFHPRIALEWKTSHTIRTVLNTMRETVYDLQDEGRIDEVEASMFIKVIESKMKRLLAAPPKIKEPTVNKILEGITWIDNDKDLIHFLRLYGLVMTFKTGDVIVQAGDVTGLGVFFVLRGLVKIEANTFTNFLTLGNVVGEYSCLTGKPRSADLLCETPVDLLYLSQKNMHKAMETFTYLDPPLHERLWRMTSIRIAYNILTAHASYQGVSKAEVLRMFEGFEMEIIEADTFDLTMKKDVVLIAGTALVNLSLIESPCFIDSSEIKTLMFPKAQNENRNPVVLYQKE